MLLIFFSVNASFSTGILDCESKGGKIIMNVDGSNCHQNQNSLSQGKVQPVEQFSSLDHYIHRCRTEINRLDFSKQATVRNLLKEERDALTSLRNRTDIKPADKREAVVIWDPNLYLEEATTEATICYTFLPTN